MLLSAPLLWAKDHDDPRAFPPHVFDPLTGPLVQYITEVVAKEVVFLSRKEAKSGVQPARQQPPQRDDSAEDDIPF